VKGKRNHTDQNAGHYEPEKDQRRYVDMIAKSLVPAMIPPLTVFFQIVATAQQKSFLLGSGVRRWLGVWLKIPKATAHNAE
jgi:hypothetical protein